MPTGGYDEDIQMAGTWGDYIIYNVEHVALDFAALCEFMRGLLAIARVPLLRSSLIRRLPGKTGR